MWRRVAIAMLRERRWVLLPWLALLVAGTMLLVWLDPWAGPAAPGEFRRVLSARAAADVVTEASEAAGIRNPDLEDDFRLGEDEDGRAGRYSVGRFDLEPAQQSCRDEADDEPLVVDRDGARYRVLGSRIASSMKTYDSVVDGPDDTLLVEVVVEVRPPEGGETIYPGSDTLLVDGNGTGWDTWNSHHQPEDGIYVVRPGEPPRAGVQMYVVDRDAAEPLVFVVGADPWDPDEARRAIEAGRCTLLRPERVAAVGDREDIIYDNEGPVLRRDE